MFERQRAMGCSWAAPELQAEYLSILLRQRSFDEGPGGNSPTEATGGKNGGPLHIRGRMSRARQKPPIRLNTFRCCKSSTTSALRKTAKRAH